MFSVSDLNEEQISQIHAWVSEGAQMADVQKKLETEFGHTVTYMDTRFLSLDLGLEFHVEEVEEPEEVEDAEVVEGAVPEEQVEAAGGVSVEVHQVAHPGSMISGAVSFSDGETGQWMIDPEGQLSVNPETAGYQPSESDLMEFQQKLRAAVENQV